MNNSCNEIINLYTNLIVKYFTALIYQISKHFVIKNCSLKRKNFIVCN